MGVGRAICQGFGQIPLRSRCLSSNSVSSLYTLQQITKHPEFSRKQSWRATSTGWARWTSTNATTANKHRTISHRIYRSKFRSRPLPQPTSIFHFHFPSSTANTEGPFLNPEYPDHIPAYIDGISGKKLSRREVHQSALRLGYALTHSRRKELRPPTETGDVVFILSPNSLHYPIVFFACQSALLVPTLCNSSATSRDVAYQIKDSGAKIGFVHPDLVGVWEGAMEILRNDEVKDGENAEDMSMFLMASTEEVASASAEGGSGRQYRSYQSLIQPEPSQQAIEDVECQWNDAMASWGGLQVKEASCALERSGHDVSYDDTAVICYSSGTTGLPKGVSFLLIGQALCTDFDYSNFHRGDDHSSEPGRDGDNIH